MTDREKLIQIIDSSRTYVADKERLADHLIDNGVTVPVRCKDCKHYVLQACACRHENFNGIISLDGYCSYGERKYNE